MKLLLVFVLLPVCCHGFWDQFYDPIKFNAPKDRTRRAAETENDLGTSDGHEIDRRYIGPPADILRSSYGNEIESGRLMSNADQKSNDTNSNDTNEDHKEHHGVHVAGWNWDYIEGPMIICIFISIVSICKLGKSFLGISICMRPAIERRRYIVTTSLIGCAHTYTDPCVFWACIISNLTPLNALIGGLCVAIYTWCRASIGITIINQDNFASIIWIYVVGKSILYTETGQLLFQ